MAFNVWKMNGNSAVLILLLYKLAFFFFYGNSFKMVHLSVSNNDDSVYS